MISSIASPMFSKETHSFISRHLRALLFELDASASHITRTNINIKKSPAQTWLTKTYIQGKPCLHRNYYYLELSCVLKRKFKPKGEANKCKLFVFMSDPPVLQGHSGKGLFLIIGSAVPADLQCLLHNVPSILRHFAFKVEFCSYPMCYQS